MNAICGLTTTGSSNVYYFTYGSNMDRDQMLLRAPSAALEGFARLSDFRLVFNKRGRDGTAKANIQSSVENGAFVLGGLYRMPESEFDRLRSFELGYFVTIIEVDRNGAQVLARTFIAEANSVFTGRPDKDYIGHILKGAESLDLPEEYRFSLSKCAGELNL